MGVTRKKEDTREGNLNNKMKERKDRERENIVLPWSIQRGEDEGEEKLNEMKRRGKKKRENIVFQWSKKRERRYE